jgi:hypothetical protein
MFKQCTCCGAAISHDEWQRLRFVGLQHIEPGYTLELRNHDCWTTLAIEWHPMPLEVTLYLEEARAA